MEAEELRLDAALRAGHHRGSAGRSSGTGGRGTAARAPVGAAGAGPVPGRAAGRRVAHPAPGPRVLVDELGVDPGPELVELEQAILRQDPALVAAVGPDRAERDVPLPRPGALRRRRRRRVLRSRTARSRRAWAGSPRSACSRSSDPRAAGSRRWCAPAWLPSLRTQRPPRRGVTPGSRPMDALTALPASGPVPVLVVDQCEEAVTLCDDPAVQATFFAALAAHAERGAAGHRAARRPPRRAVGSPGLRPPRRARAAPVERHERRRPAGRDRGPRPSGRPAAGARPGRSAGAGGARVSRGRCRCCRTRCTRRGSDARAARSPSTGYQATGGIRGSVAQSAEEVYNQVPAEQRPLLRDLLLRLVTPTPDGEPVRSRVPRRTVVSDAEHERLIELLVRARLVTSDDDTVELAHESLARAWPRLRNWLDDDVEGQRILRHLALTADAWDGMGRPDSELYRGGPPRPKRSSGRPSRPRPHPGGAALPRHQRRRERAEAAAPRSGSATRPARTGGCGRCSPAPPCLLGGRAASPGSSPSRQADRADRSSRRDRPADARRVGAQALLVDDLDRSLLLAVEGLRLDDSTDTRANLLAALSRSPQLIASTRADGPGLISVGVSPDGDGRRRRRGVRRRVVLRHEHPGAARHLRRDAGLEVGVPARRQAARCQRTARPQPRDRSWPAIPAARRCRHVRGRAGAARRHTRRAPSYQRRTTAPTAGSWARRSRGPTAATTRPSSSGTWPRRNSRCCASTCPAGYELELSADGSLLYVGRADPPGGDSLRGRDRPSSVRSSSVPAAWLELSPDGTLLAAAGGTRRGRARMRRASPRCAGCRATPTRSRRSASHPAGLSWRQAPTIAPPSSGTSRPASAAKRCGAHSSAVWGVGFSPDGSTLYTSRRADTAHLGPRRRPPVHRSPIAAHRRGRRSSLVEGAFLADR